MVLRHCKQTASRPAALWLACCMLAAMSACSAPFQRTISLQALEDGPAAVPDPVGQVMLAESASIAGVTRELGPRLAVCQLRSPSDWQRLREAYPHLGPCPDFVDGMVIGLVSRLGAPLSGRWPVRIEDARVREGAVLLTAHFEGGSYFPDGTSYLDLVWVPSARQVLVVEINGVRYYLD